MVMAGLIVALKAQALNLFVIIGLAGAAYFALALLLKTVTIKTMLSRV